MFFYRARLFSLFGFDVYVDASWLLLAVLITWSLAVGVFPSIDPGLTSGSLLVDGGRCDSGPLVFYYSLPRNVPCGGGARFWHADPRHYPFYLRRCRRDA